MSDKWDLRLSEARFPMRFVGCNKRRMVKLHLTLVLARWRIESPAGLRRAPDPTIYPSKSTLLLFVAVVIDPSVQRGKPVLVRFQMTFLIVS